MIQSFSSGKAPFAITGPWAVSDIETKGGDALKFVVEPIPPVDGDPAKPFIGVQGFYQSAFAENAALAEEFLLNYVNTPETAMALFEAQPRVPALTEVADQVADDPIVAGFQKAGEASASAAGGGSLPNIKEMAAVWDAWTNAYVQIFGGADPTDGTDPGPDDDRATDRRLTWPSPPTRPVRRRPRSRRRRTGRTGPGSSSSGSCSIIFNGIVVAFIPRFIDEGSWFLLAFVVLVLVAVDLTYTFRERIPGKWLIPGSAFLVLFGVFPVIYTVYISFTNYGTCGSCGLLTEEQAVNQIVNQSVAPIPDGPTYRASVFEGSDGLFLVVQDQASPDAPVPGRHERGPGGGRPVEDRRHRHEGQRVRRHPGAQRRRHQRPTRGDRRAAGPDGRGGPVPQAAGHLQRQHRQPAVHPGRRQHRGHGRRASRTSRSTAPSPPPTAAAPR